MLALMFLRFYLLIKAITSFSLHMDTYAKQLCKAYGFNSSLLFNIKSQIVVKPEKTVIYIFLTTLFLTAYIVRIFEIPYFRIYRESQFDSFFTALWWTVITMTTIGYGDISPCTPPGQIITMLFAFWHSLLLSLLVVVCSSVFELSDGQKLAVSHLSSTKKAAETITKAARYFVAKNRTK